MQLSPDCLPDTLTLELAKDVVDRRARRKAVARQIAPGAAGAQQIENGIHRRSHVSLAWSPAGQCLRNQWCQPRPLRISEIARIAGALPPINLAVLLRPHRCSPSPLKPLAGPSCHPPPPRGLLGQALKEFDYRKLSG